MEGPAHWQLTSDLATIRERASAFLNNSASTRRDQKNTQQWSAEWTDIAEIHSQLAEGNIRKGRSDEATEAWFCALTAYEVARRLVAEDDRNGIDIAARIESCIQRLELSMADRIERVRIACGEPLELEALYLSAGSGRTPAVICISMEQEPRAILLGRFLPAAFSRKLSLLIISHDDLLGGSRRELNIHLSSCLDYLLARPDVDDGRIGIYGEGGAGALATDFAAADSRLAAAVCDGGLWASSRNSASIGWFSGAMEAIDGSLSTQRSEKLRQLRCPVLVVIGGRGHVSASEAVALQANCMAESIDLELVMAPIIRASGNDIENFVSVDDRTLKWLQTKLGASQAMSSTNSQFN